MFAACTLLHSTNFLCGLNAVHLGHLYVHQDDVGLEFDALAHGVFTVAHAMVAPDCQLQFFLGNCLKYRIIVSDENQSSRTFTHLVFTYSGMWSRRATDGMDIGAQTEILSGATRIANIIAKDVALMQRVLATANPAAQGAGDYDDYRCRRSMPA